MDLLRKPGVRTLAAPMLPFLLSLLSLTACGLGRSELLEDPDGGGTVNPSHPSHPTHPTPGGDDGGDPDAGCGAVPNDVCTDGCGQPVGIVCIDGYWQCPSYVGTGGECPIIDPPPPGNVCTDIEVSPDEVSCEVDQDCALVVTGVICPGYVPGSICVHEAANNTGAGRIAAVMSGIPQDDDAGFPPDICDVAVGTPRCLAGQCTVCGPFGAGPAACYSIFDGGVLVEDGGN